MKIKERDYIRRMEEMDESVRHLLDELKSASDSDFPIKLMANVHWNRARGDLLHWVPVLNRIDLILEKYITEYGLESDYPKLRLISSKDSKVICACLAFTKTLLKNCSDNQIYSSTERIYALLNTPTSDVRLKALEVAVIFGERYANAGSSRFSPPKNVKEKVLELAKSYPPLVPPDCPVRAEDERNKSLDGKTSIVGDHYNFVDTLDPEKPLPKRWKGIYFQYYKSAVSGKKDNEPLRKKRSTGPGASTATGQNGDEDGTLVEGLQTFAIPESLVAKMSLQQILSKGSESLPKSSWFQFLMMAENVKSLNSQSKEAFALREKLIQIKCLAVGYCCCTMSNQNTSFKLLEAEPYIFSFLVDAILPDSRQQIPAPVYGAAMKALECISMKRAWGRDILQSMGGNVNHGILFQCLRNIRELASTNQQGFEEEIHMPFFNMLSHMIKTKSLLPRLTSGGLLLDLIPFLDLDSKYQWTCSAAVYLLYLCMSGTPDSIDTFIANDGFTKLINAVGKQVDLHLTNPHYDSSLGEVPQYTTIPIRSVNLLKNLMRLVADLLNSDHGDRLRNLFDSPILGSFNKIFTHPLTFGPQILSFTVDSVFYIIHNEPTAFSILNEAQVVNTLLNNYGSLFLPSSQLVMSLAEVLGAISLNKAGLDKVIENNSVEVFFKYFFDLKVARVMVDSDMATNVGCSIDELGRHYSQLKPIILDQTLKLIEKMPEYVDQRLKGVQLYQPPQGEAKGLFFESKSETISVNFRNEEVNSSNDDQNNDSKNGTESQVHSWDNGAYTFMLDNVYFFLSGLFQDSGQWGADAVKKIPFDAWLKFLTLQNAPYDYFLSNGLTALLVTLKYLDEEDAEYSIHKMTDELADQLKTDIVSKYINYEGDGSFFASISQDEANSLIQHLNTINILLFMLTEIYINLALDSDRIRQILQIFGVHSFLGGSLCKFLLRSITEEAILQATTPDEVLKLTSNFPADSPPLQIYCSDPSKKEANTLGTNAKFKNVLQLRTLNYYSQGYISLVLATTVRACLPKRHDHPIDQLRRDGVEILLSIAQGLTDAFNTGLHQQQQQHENENEHDSRLFVHEMYLLVLSNIILYILSQKEKGKDVVYTPFAIALFQLGFFESLNKAAISMWNSLLNMDVEEVKATLDLKYIKSVPGSIVKNALSQMFLIYARIVNADDVAPISFVKGYFHTGYSSNIDAEVISSFLIQIRGEALELLTSLVSNENAAIFKNSESCKNVPSPLIDQLVHIAQNVFKGDKELNRAEFVPLDTRLVSPPEDQVAYLISLGMTESQANHYFDHHKNVRDLSIGIPMTCPIFLDIKEDQWKAFADEYASADVDFSIELKEFTKVLKILEKREQSWSIHTWLDIATLYPRATPAIANLFTSLSKKNVFSEILSEANKFPEKISGERFAVLLRLIALVLRTNVSNAAFPKELTNLFQRIHITQENVNEEYAQYLMALFEQILLYQDVPDAEETKHTSIIPKTLSYFGEKEKLMDTMLESLTQIKDVKDGKTANTIARVLAIYAKHYAYETEIASLSLIASLLKSVRDESLEKLVRESLKTSLVFIFRGSFETRDVIHSIMKYEVDGVFARGYRQTKSLRAMLKDNFQLVFRDPKALTDVLETEIILDAFSGSQPLSHDIKVTKTKPDSKATTSISSTAGAAGAPDAPDAPVAPASANSIPTTTISATGEPDHRSGAASQDGVDKSTINAYAVNLLMLELMDIAKKDVYSDPKNDEQETTSKDAKKPDLNSNPNFAYACYLLQTLAELLASYKQAKFNFLTYSRKKQAETKLRFTSLNFFMHQLIPTQPFEDVSETVAERKRAISSLAKVALMSLVSTQLLDDEEVLKLKKEDPDLALIRRFVVDLLLKVLKETSTLTALARDRYGKLLDLLDLSTTFISSKNRESLASALDKESTKHDLFYMTRVYSEKQMSTTLTSLIAEFDLNYPDIEKVVKSALKPITILGKNKIDYQESFAEEGNGEGDEDDIVPDDEDNEEERDDTPDLFRHSTLGMYDLEVESEEDDYDEDGLEVVMSGDDIDGDSLSDLSAEDSGVDDDDDDAHGDMEEEDDMGEGVDIEMRSRASDDDDDDDDSGDDSEGSSLDDIEIIDELDIDSSDEEGDFDEDDIIVDVDEVHPGEYSDVDDDEEEEEDEDDDSSSYDEEELEGWIEELEGEASDDQTSSAPRASRRRMVQGDDDRDVDDESDGNASDFEGDEDEGDGLGGTGTRTGTGRGFEVRMVTPDHGLRRIFNQADLTQFSGNPGNAFSMLVDGLFRDSSFRGTIDYDNQGRVGIPSIGTLFESMLHMGHGHGEGGHIFKCHIKSTKERWSEAVSMFDPPNIDLMIEKIIPGIVNRIEGPSIEAYRKRQEELDRIKKEQEEKRRKQIEEEQKRLEEEAEAAAARRRQQSENAASDAGDTEAEGATAQRDPVFVRIGDRDVDISGTDIDPDYIMALPEDMREEVLALYVRERRANATRSNSDAREIDPDFLDALPGNVREEILQLESFARRYASMSSGSRNVFEDAMDGFGEIDEEEEEDDGQDVDEEEDEDEEDESNLGEDNVGENGGNESSRRRHHHRRSRRRSSAANNAGTNRTSKAKNSSKIYFTPLVDKAGIASIVRLIFSPLPIPQREQIFQTLHYICHNKQSRVDIINMMLSVLSEGFTSHKLMQMMFSQVCSRASNRDGKWKLPQNTTPISVAIQFIESVDYLLERNSHLRYFLLAEHDNPYLSKKQSKKVGKEGKFQINFLIKLLNNRLLADDQTFADILARVLQLSTRPLNGFKNIANDQTPPFPYPFIPDDNFGLIVKILTANECSNSTFRQTISAMQNLSVLSNAQKLFTQELSERASEYGGKIIVDLHKLTKELAEGEATNAKSFMNFSAHSSDQAKLLRVLTALDYMHEKKNDKKENQAQEPEGEIEELTKLYKSLSLGTLWDALSECLRVLEKNPSLIYIANALLPLIEALMVVCKHCKVANLSLSQTNNINNGNSNNNASNAAKYELKKVDFTKEPIESLFFSFTDEHKKILNSMVRANANLMSGPFGMLVKNPRVLEFDNKKNFFDRKLHENKKEQPKLAVDVRREQVFLDSYRSLFFKNKDEFKNSKLEITFKGELGIDAGGVTREWYQVLSRQMFNPDYALFTPVVSDSNTFHPNRTSYINPEHLSFFKFIGRIIGKAIYDNCFLDCHFTRAVYKRILGQPQSLKDMETLDLEYYKSLLWMLENDITDVITETFSVETDDYGEHKVIDLIENGRDTPVTEENKHEYVKKVVEYKLQTSVEEQMENFLIGFHEIIPKELVAIFDEKELELLISGLPDIDVHDWQMHSTYSNYSPSSLQIQWFWRAVKSFDNEERARLLQFATGTSKVPLNGFKELSGASGTSKFSIHRDYGSTDRLPSSHTCFNQIDLPAYENYETLRGALLMAITEGHEGFGLA